MSLRGCRIWQWRLRSRLFTSRRVAGIAYQLSAHQLSVPKSVSSLALLGTWCRVFELHCCVCVWRLVLRPGVFAYPGLLASGGFWAKSVRKGLGRNW